MQRSPGRKRWNVVLGLLAPILFALSGCAMGPKAIRSDRLDYAEAINETEDAQILLSIVKGRYGLTSSLLAVNGVAANMRFRAALGIEAGFPGAGDPGDDLLTGDVAYEENPTITYTPVQGEQYVRQLLAPIPLDIVMLTLRSTTSRDRFLTLMVSRVNDLRNPEFLVGPAARPDSGFTRFVELFSELCRADVIDVVRGPEEELEYDLVISGYAPRYVQQVDELLGLLGLQVPTQTSTNIVLPMHLAVIPETSSAIGIITRSTFDLLEMLRAAVEVPAEHVQAGLVVDYPPIGLPGKGIHIHSSVDKPTGGSPAVQFKGYWFYVRDDDPDTKVAFSTLRTMWSMSIARSATESRAPVLTIPLNQ